MTTYAPTPPPLTAYRLPNGQIVRCDSTATKDAPTIGFTLADGTVVEATRADLTPPLTLTEQDCRYETTHDYQARCLRWILATDQIRSLTREQLEQADQGAQRYVAGLPRELDQVAGTLNAKVGDIRHRIARELTARRASLTQAQRLLDQLDADTTDQDEAPGGPQAPEPTSEERAVRLLKAALMLIMGDQPGPSGGSKARLTPPPPTRPPSGTALQVPGTKPNDGVNF